jgi:hypothetical protein
MWVTEQSFHLRPGRILNHVRTLMQASPKTFFWFYGGG